MHAAGTVGCCDSARGPLHVPLLLQSTDRTSCSDSGCSQSTPHRLLRFSPRDDSTGSTCVPCVKNGGARAPSYSQCWVKSAPLKSHEPSRVRAGRGCLTGDRCRCSRGAEPARASSGYSARTFTASITHCINMS